MQARNSIFNEFQRVYGSSETLSDRPTVLPGESSVWQTTTFLRCGVSVARDVIHLSDMDDTICITKATLDKIGTDLEEAL